MENNPTPNNNSEKKPSTQGGGNFVWYLLALGVGLLLMVTLLQGNAEEQISWSNLERLIIASKQGVTGADAEEHPGWIVVEQKQGDTTVKKKISMLDRIVVSDDDVTGKVTVETIQPAAATTTEEENGSHAERSDVSNVPRRRRRAGRFASRE